MGIQIGKSGVRGLYDDAFALFNGGTINFDQVDSDYSGWSPNLDSPILGGGAEPTAADDQAIHAAGYAAGYHDAVNKAGYGASREEGPTDTVSKALFERGYTEGYSAGQAFLANSGVDSATPEASGSGFPVSFPLPGLPSIALPTGGGAQGDASSSEEGMSTGKKVALAAGGAALLLGGIWLAKKKKRAA